MENWKVQFTAKATLPGNVDKPSHAEMVKFLFGTLEMKYEDIKCMQLSISGKEILFRCHKEETMKRIVDNFDGAPFKFENGSVARVRMSQESESLKYVRVWGIPPDAPDGDVARFFGHYGDVKRVLRERFPKELNCPIETGVRGIHMDLRQELPHFMYIRNFRIKVHYEGQKERCFGCGSTDHIRVDCPKKPMTPASRVETMVNLNSFLEPSSSATVPTVTPAAPLSPVPDTQQLSVTPALTFANVVSTSEHFQFASQTSSRKSFSENDDDYVSLSPSPTNKMLPPVTRQSRSRVPTRVASSSRDRSSHSGSSSNRSVGRPKKMKHLPIETIARGPSSGNSSRNAETDSTPPDDNMLTETTTEGSLDVVMGDFGNVSN
jgi:hypothetical protein